MDFFKKKTRNNEMFESYTKIVVLVGGAGYVGKAFLHECADLTQTLFVVVSPKSTFSSQNVISIRADITKDPEETIRKILSLTGRIDVFVYMAAVYAFDTAEKLSLSNLRREFEVNTFAPLLSTQELCKQHWDLFTVEENKQKERKAIVIGSQAGEGKTKRKDLIVYSATKAALSVAWEYYADFLNTKGIQSIFLKPGGLQEKEELDVFVRTLKEHILS